MPPPGGPQERRTPTPLSPGNPQAAAADTASVDAIIAALYASVSHPDGQDPDWARMRKIFLPVGMLVPPKRANQDMFTVLDVDGFRDLFRQGMAAAKQRGETNAFYETEIARQLDCFGNVCQAFSTYESRRAPTDEKPFTRGINSIQLLQRRPALVDRLHRLGHRAPGQPDSAGVLEEVGVRVRRAPSSARSRLPRRP